MKTIFNVCGRRYSCCCICLTSFGSCYVRHFLILPIYIHIIDVYCVGCITILLSILLYMIDSQQFLL